MASSLKVKLLKHTPDPELLIATAARLCYSNSDIDQIMENFTEEKVDKFVTLLSELGHASPVEHATFTFAVEGVSRTLTHQLVRHRVASYSQQSQRYVKLDQFEYVIPPAIASNETAKEIFIDAMRDDQIAYDGLVHALLHDYITKDPVYTGDEDSYKKLKKKHEKKAIEDARYVFPNACETKIVFTMNIRTLLNFFAHRCCNRAQWEIRELAYEMLKLVKEVAPRLFKNAGRPCLSGSCPENDMQCDMFKGIIPTDKEAKDIVKKHYKRAQ